MDGAELPFPPQAPSSTLNVKIRSPVKAPRRSDTAQDAEAVLFTELPLEALTIASTHSPIVFDSRPISAYLNCPRLRSAAEVVPSGSTSLIALIGADLTAGNQVVR
jgi:hypothetical protein